MHAHKWTSQINVVQVKAVILKLMDIQAWMTVTARVFNIMFPRGQKVFEICLRLWQVSPVFALDLLNRCLLE